MDPDKFSIGPAAGMVRRLDQVMKVAKSAATEITVGTISWEKREGNRPTEGSSGGTYYFDEGTGASVNALGIPDSIAASGYMKLLPEMVSIAHAADKTLRVSIGSFKVDDELTKLALMCEECGVDEVEWNAGCPNLRPSTGQKVIPSYDPETMERILRRLKRAGVRPVAVKISPIDDELIPKLAKIFNESGMVQKVVEVNAEPNFIMMKGEFKPALEYYGEDNQLYSTGGRAGKPLKEHGLRVVSRMRPLLRKDILITGVGGIFTGSDVQAYLNAGADNVQVGTAYFEYGENIFGDILSGM